MNPVLDEVASMIRELASLSEGQRVRFLSLIGKLDAQQLEKLKNSLKKVQEEELKAMKSQVETLKQTAAVYHEWKADKARVHLHASERSSAQNDAASADSLLSNL